MTQHQDFDTLLERAAEQIRQSEPDPARAEEASARVWNRLTTQDAATTSAADAAEIGEIRGCEDYQALIPAYLDGTLPAARKLLLEDHTRECLPCHRALKEAREGKVPAVDRGRKRGRVAAFPRQMTRWALAAALVAALGATLYFLSGALLYGGATAEVMTVDGDLFRVTSEAQLPLEPGAEIREGDVVRTGRSGGAVIQLEDGSKVEIRERSELSIDEARSGTTIALGRGNVIVEAAPQRSRHLYVSTEECLVSVTGTIFAVNHGTKGSRVSVVEGEVRVAYDGDETILLPGEQVATRSSLGIVPVKDEIAWSRNVDEYLELLQEFSELRRELAERLPQNDLRHTSRLLDLMPESTLVYVAVPNLTDNIAETYRVIQERLNESPVLRQRWEERQGAHHLDAEIGDIVAQVEEFGDFLGMEIAVGIDRSVTESDATAGGPLVLAEIVDAAGLRAFVESLEDNLVDNGPFTEDDAIFVDDPFAALPEGDVYLWLTDDLLVVTPSPVLLRQVAEVAGGAVNPFLETDFHAQISALYAEGVDILAAADLEGMIETALASSEEMQSQADTFERLGVMNARHVLAEQKKIDKTYHRVTLTFSEARTGIAAWLAEPAPMGSLDFISPDAKLVAAAVTKDPAELFDDLLSFVPEGEEGPQNALEELEARFGIDLREDFMAVLGGEVAFAIDGPIFPDPSWKLIFELYDPARFQFIVEQAVAEANVHLTSEGMAPIELTAETAGGRTFYDVTLPLPEEMRMGSYSFTYTFVDGYGVMAPNRALLDRAIRSREAGFTITQSSRFRELLPVDNHNNFSALVYQDLSGLMGEVAERLGEGELTPEQRQTIDELQTESKPTLGYAYGETDRITLAAASDQNLTTSLLRTMLGVENPLGFGQILEQFEGLGD